MSPALDRYQLKHGIVHSSKFVPRFRSICIILGSSIKCPSMSYRGDRKHELSELPPVQLVKQPTPTPPLSEEESMLRADNSIQRPENNLWVLSAGDKQIIKYTVNAVVHGKIAI